MKTLFRDTLSQTPIGRLAEIVESWHRGWEEVGTERGNGRKDFTKKAFRKIVFSLIRLKMELIGPKNLTRSKNSVFQPKNAFFC